MSAEPDGPCSEPGCTSAGTWTEAYQRVYCGWCFLARFEADLGIEQRQQPLLIH